MRLDDMGHLGASQARSSRGRPADLLLAEMSRAPINPQVRSKRDDRQRKGHARGAMTSGCCYSQDTPAPRICLMTWDLNGFYISWNYSQAGLFSSLGRMSLEQLSSR